MRALIAPSVKGWGGEGVGRGVAMYTKLPKVSAYRELSPRSMGVSVFSA